MQKWNNRLAVGLVMAAIAGLDLNAQAMRFVIPEYPPYTGIVNGKPAGVGVGLVEYIMKEAGLTMTMRVVSTYARCVAEVQSGDADGFFLASKNAERDAIAVMSERILINKWTWILPKDSVFNPTDTDFKSKARIGVILNTNQNIWLKNNGYIISGTPTTNDALIMMLDSNRFDAALAPELVFLDALETEGKIKTAYKFVVQSEQSFAMYVSKQYLAKNPSLMDKINAAIKKVAP